MPDLARAIKYNPLLKVQLNTGYFDLLTPYFQGMYEMRHLPIPPELRANIEFRCYQSGHMVYLTPDARHGCMTMSRISSSGPQPAATTGSGAIRDDGLCFGPVIGNATGRTTRNAGSPVLYQRLVRLTLSSHVMARPSGLIAPSLRHCFRGWSGQDTSSGRVTLPARNRPSASPDNASPSLIDVPADLHHLEPAQVTESFHALVIAASIALEMLISDVPTTSTTLYTVSVIFASLRDRSRRCAIIIRSCQAIRERRSPP